MVQHWAHSSKVSPWANERTCVLKQWIEKGHWFESIRGRWWRLLGSHPADSQEQFSPSICLKLVFIVAAFSVWIWCSRLEVFACIIYIYILYYLIYYIYIYYIYIYMLYIYMLYIYMLYIYMLYIYMLYIYIIYIIYSIHMYSSDSSLPILITTVLNLPSDCGHVPFVVSAVRCTQVTCIGSSCSSIRLHCATPLAGRWPAALLWL